MAKRYLARSRASEDVTGLAGWLFTDLLLGLVMVFISAVAFVAYKSVDPDGSPSAPICADYEGTFLEKPVFLEYSDGGGSEIGKDIAEEIKAKMNTFKNPRVAVGVIYGWYAGGGSANDGVKVAKAFYDRFHVSDPGNFPAFGKDRKVPNMRFIGSAGEYAPKDGAGVELFFVYDTCSKNEPAPTTTTP
jgi:hypothetical protein